MFTAIIKRLRKLWNIIVRAEETQAVIQWLWVGSKWLWERAKFTQVGLPLVMGAITIIWAWLQEAAGWQIWLAGLVAVAAVSSIVWALARIYEIASRVIYERSTQDDSRTGLEFVFRNKHPFVQWGNISLGNHPDRKCHTYIMVRSTSLSSWVHNVRVHMECDCLITNRHGSPERRLILSTLRPYGRGQPTVLPPLEKELFIFAQQVYSAGCDPRVIKDGEVAYVERWAPVSLITSDEEKIELWSYRNHVIEIKFTAYGIGVVAKEKLTLRFDDHGKLSIAPDRVGDYPDDATS